MRKVVFCNIAWMTNYAGYSNSDKAYGGGSYKAEWKHEQYNFLNQNGKFYGYVQPTNDKIDLRKIDPSIPANACELEDVLVIFTAPNYNSRGLNPNEKATYVVGWYDHATVHKYSLEREGYKHFSYYFEAQADDCVLLPEKERTWLVRRSPQYGEGYMGRSNVWYGNPSLTKYDQETVQSIVDHVESIIEKIENYQKEHTEG